MPRTMKCELCEHDGGVVLWRDEFCRVVSTATEDYPGFCRVILNRHVREMTDLEPPERERLMRVVFACELALRRLYRPDKLNLASLGNQVPHLHWHLFPRYVHDPERLKPVWLALERAERDERERLRLQSGALGRRETAERLRQRLTEMAAG
jgi:diadenosine tetraphosphate (Ap4A) HIT family hydrolase